MKREVGSRVGGEDNQSISRTERGSLTARRLPWVIHSPLWKENNIQRCGFAEGGKRETGTGNSGILAAQFISILEYIFLCG